jgi:hypothetical protein
MLRAVSGSTQELRDRPTIASRIGDEGKGVEVTSGAPEFEPDRRSNREVISDLFRGSFIASRADIFSFGMEK